jgi:hypothetical protein
MQSNSFQKPGDKPPIRPDRVRKIGSEGFAFLPNRFFRDGFFAALSPTELRLYVFLVLVANRSGLSYYRSDRICSILETPEEDYLAARDGLIRRDLLAFDKSRFQVLELPQRVEQRVQPGARTKPQARHDAGRPLKLSSEQPAPAAKDSECDRERAAAYFRAVLESLGRR